MIFVNVWGLHHDEAKFTNPDTFDPDHYKNHPLLASEYANVNDYENRDHYGYGLCSPILVFEIPLMKIQATADDCAPEFTWRIVTFFMPFQRYCGHLRLKRVRIQKPDR